MYDSLGFMVDNNHPCPRALPSTSVLAEVTINRSLLRTIYYITHESHNLYPSVYVPESTVEVVRSVSCISIILLLAGISGLFPFPADKISIWVWIKTMNKNWKSRYCTKFHRVSSTDNLAVNKPIAINVSFHIDVQMFCKYFYLH